MLHIFKTSFSINSYGLLFLNSCKHSTYFIIKVNKSVYIAKSRQQYYKTLNNILLHVPNHALKDVYMLNYGIIKNTNSSYYTRFFVIKFFYHIISSKQTHLVFCTFPTIFEQWIKEASNFQKAKVQPKCVRFCFFPSLVLLINKHVVPSRC